MTRVKFEDATREYCEELLDYYNWHYSSGPYSQTEEVVEEPVGTDQIRLSKKGTSGLPFRLIFTVSHGEFQGGYGSTGYDFSCKW